MATKVTFAAGDYLEDGTRLVRVLAWREDELIVEDASTGQTETITDTSAWRKVDRGD